MTENEENPIYGIVVKDKGEYNLLAEYAGAKEFKNQQLIKMLLEAISDEKFNKLLTDGNKVKIKIKFETKEISLQGQVLGGDDPTRPLRERNSEIEPQQGIKILLDEIPSDEILGWVEGKRAEIIFHNKI